jgi:hypothetical protein
MDFEGMLDLAAPPDGVKALAVMKGRYAELV